MLSQGLISGFADSGQTDCVDVGTVLRDRGLEHLGAPF